MVTSATLLRSTIPVTVAYWTSASLLVVFYLYSGGIKVVRSKDRLRPMMGWVDSVPLSLVRSVGVLEVLGALGLILPPLTTTAASLALAAAIGLGVLQVSATTFHLARRETNAIGLNLVLLALAGVTAWLSTSRR